MLISKNPIGLLNVDREQVVGKGAVKPSGCLLSMGNSDGTPTEIQNEHPLKGILFRRIMGLLTEYEDYTFTISAPFVG